MTPRVHSLATARSRVRPGNAGHSLSTFALIALLAFSCTTDGTGDRSEDAVPTDVDPDTVDTSVGADTGAAPDVDTGTAPDVDTGTAPDTMPGSCFEIFGPEGISHSPPRVHEAGLVKVGASLEIGVNVYNFCGDPDARVEAITVLDATAGLEVSTRGLEPGVVVSQDADLFTTLTPTVEGSHRATVRLAMNHGHYDFSIELEASELVSGVGESCGTNMSLPCTVGTLCVQTMPEACDPMWWGTCEPVPASSDCDAIATVCDCSGQIYGSVCDARRRGVGERLEPCAP